VAGKSKKSDGAKKGRIYELTRKEMFLWLGVAFLALIWMFTLGVIVGRGLSPVRFDVEKLAKELIDLKEAALKSAEGTKEQPVDLASEKAHLGFYDVLTDKKEEARLKSLAKPRKDPVQTGSSKANRTAGKTETGIQRKTAVSKKDIQDSSPVGGKRVSTEGSFTLQVASLKDLSKAENVVSLLKKKGFMAYTVTAHVSGKGTYHRVRVGRFKDRNDARETASKLRAENYAPIVIRE